MKRYNLPQKYSPIIFGLFILALSPRLSFAQLTNNLNLGELHGNFQAVTQYYVTDSAIGAYEIDEKVRMNGFANIIYTKGKFTGGIRYESYLNGLSGYPAGYKGTGIPYRFVTYKSGNLEITAGSFYEQFGNGLVLRTYEERNLGLDNALDGVRLKYEPFKGVYLKGLIGKQRSYFTQGPGIVRGLDGEIQLNEAFQRFAEKKLIVSIGGSFVSKYQADQNPALVLPKNVGASAARFMATRNNFSINGEYAYKINDPSLDNNNIYKSGNGLLLQANYAVKGFAISLSGSRMDNMSFRSDRNAQITDLLLNYIPALNKQHTYSLLTFYPYASQSKGEMEYSSELKYKFKKETFLGGKYGTEIIINYSGANSIDTTNLEPVADSARIGYKSDFFKIGKTVYFRDFYVELNKKFSKEWKASLIYSYQAYNKGIIQEPGFPIFYSNIIVADVGFRFKPESSLRLELQYLATKQDQGNWAYALLEYIISTNWYVAVGDQYNYGNDDGDLRFHYYNLSAGFIKEANRIELSYGKQRAGIFCVGGVCRNVPASNGLTLTITSSF